MESSSFILCYVEFFRGDEVTEGLSYGEVVEKLYLSLPKPRCRLLLGRFHRVMNSVFSVLFYSFAFHDFHILDMVNIN